MCHNKIFISGGIGDVFALDSHWSPQDKANLQVVLTATRQHTTIRELFLSNKSHFPKLQSVVSVFDDWTADRQAIYHKGEVPNLPDCQDQSIAVQFFQQLQYHGSSWIGQHKPEDFVVIVPSSVNYYPGRDFTASDWAATVQYLHNNKQKGIVLNNHATKIPRHPLLIDQTGLTIQESIDVLHGCTAYIGIDSCLSVLAAQLPIPLKIKTVNPHYLMWKHLYAAPRKEFSFLKPYIEYQP